MSRIIKIEVERCTDCLFYNLKKNKCILGAKDKGDQQDNFYLDCPLECGEVKKDEQQAVRK